MCGDTRSSGTSARCSTKKEKTCRFWRSKTMRALRMRADGGERGGVTELAGDHPRGAKRDRGDGPDQNRSQQHAGDQQSSSHAAMNRNASASENVLWIS